jgi:hypothetical protein
VVDDLPDVPPGNNAIKVFADSTPNAIILNRIARRAIEIVQPCTDLTEQQKGDYFDLVLLVFRKMISVWKHLAAYKAEEDRLLKAFQKGARHTEYSLELFIQFDEFTVQIKSTLDQAVKVLRPIIVPKWNIATFGDKGETVIKALRNLGPREAGRVKGFETMCFDDDTRAWLKAIIDSSDRVNHYLAGGLNIRNFTVGPLPDGTMAVPRWSEQQTLRDAMEASWTKFFAFLEFFVIYSLNFRMPDKHALMYQRSAIVSPESSFKVVPKSVADAIITRLGSYRR